MNRYTVLAAVWGLSIFLPYPAIPVGANTGLQVGHLLMVGLAPLALVHRYRIAWAWYAYLLLAVPQFIGVFAQGFSSMSMNAAVVQIITMLVIPVTALVFQSRPRTFLAAVCVALAFHGAIGIWQWFAFDSHEFPLAGLFVNPSFAPYDEEQIELYSEYVQRPMGLTPEPSAMMTMTMGWVLLLLTASVDGSTRNGLPFFRLTAWRVIGLSMFLFTMVISKSGGVGFFGAGLAALILMNVARHAGRRPGMSLITLIGFVVAAVLSYFHLMQRVESETTQRGSWDERSISIQIGLRLIREADFLEMLFGYGGGEVSRIADRLQSTAAVHSWLLSELVGYGLVGLLGLIGLVVLLARAAARSGDPWSWAIMLAVWATGPTLLTGYIHLLSTWAFLAIPLSLAHLGEPGRAWRLQHLPDDRPAGPNGSVPAIRTARMSRGFHAP